MSNNLKIQSPWTQLGLFIGLLGGGLVFYSLVTAIFLGSKGAIDLHSTDPAMIVKIKWLQAIFTIFFFGLPGLIYAQQTFRNTPLLSFGFRPAEKSIFYVIGILLLITSFPFESWVGELNKHLPLPAWMVRLEQDTDQRVAAFVKINHPSDIVINLTLMAILPAICEEICFRGVLQRILIRLFKNPWAGIVATGIVFSAVHGQFQGFFPRMFLGILLGAAFWYSQSLWTSILAHAFFNGIQVVAAGYDPAMVDSSPAVSPLLALVSLLIIVGLLIYMRKLSTASYSKVYPEPAGAFDQYMGN